MCNYCQKKITCVGISALVPLAEIVEVTTEKVLAAASRVSSLVSLRLQNHGIRLVSLSATNPNAINVQTLENLMKTAPNIRYLGM
jgi:hypothetical protein